MNKLREHKLNICMVAPFPPRKGGVTVQSALLTRYLKKSGVRVLKVDTNLQCLRVRGFGPLRLALQPWVVLFRLLIQIPKCDVVHFHAASFWGYMPTFIGIPIALLFRKRSVVSYHGGKGPRFFDRCGWFAKMPLKVCTVATVCSDKLYEEFHARGIKVELHHNLFESTRFKFCERANIGPNICWIRSLDEIYDPLAAIKSFDLLRKRYPNASLTMAGNGPMHAMLADYISRHAISGVTLAGRLSADDVARLMSESSICLNTSHCDGLPTALLEAAATGIPIVTTKVGGIATLFKDGESAVFVEPGDCEAMSDAICWLIENPDKAKAMGVAARDVSEKYTWHRNSAEYERFYGLTKGTLSAIV